jgi:sec-independent protein translocase protein TatB
MFDIGISEIAVIGVVALVVLGPERLPKVARTAGHMFGRLQRYVATVKADINREMDASEFSKLKEEVTSAAKSFEQSIHEQTSAIETEARAIEKAAAVESPKTMIEATTPAPTQAALLAAQEDGLNDAAAATHAPHHAPPQMPNAAIQSALQSFDLGIEPPRQLRRYTKQPN